MIDTRWSDFEEINRTKNSQILMWVMFFVVLLASIVITGELVAHMSKASEEINRIEGVKIYNKFGEIVKEIRSPRFEVMEDGSTTDWLKYWDKRWNRNAVMIFVVLFLTILIEVLLVVQIKYLYRKEMMMIYKYELEKHSKPED